MSNSVFRSEKNLGLVERCGDEKDVLHSITHVLIIGIGFTCYNCGVKRVFSIINIAETKLHTHMLHKYTYAHANTNTHTHTHT